MHQSHCSIGQSCGCLEQGVCKTTRCFSSGLLCSHVASVSVVYHPRTRTMNIVDICMYILLTLVYCIQTFTKIQHTYGWYIYIVNIKLFLFKKYVLACCSLLATSNTFSDCQKKFNRHFDFAVFFLNNAIIYPNEIKINL